MKKLIMVGLGFIRHPSELKDEEQKANRHTAILWWKPLVWGSQNNAHFLKWIAI